MPNPEGYRKALRLMQLADRFDMPIVTLVGLDIPWFLSGVVLIEAVFAWPGLGQVTLNALLNWDTTLVIGCVVGSTILLVSINLAADILLLLLDPRTRLEDGTI